MAKMTATENAQRVIDRGRADVRRAAAWCSGEIVERLYRDIRALRIYEGATEVQKLIIGRERAANDSSQVNSACPGWPRPEGYCNGIAAGARRSSSPARSAGTRSSNSSSPARRPQVRQALINIVRVLTEAGGRVRAHRAPHVVRDEPR